MGGCLAFGDPAPPKEGEEQPSQPRPQLGGVTHPLRAQQQKKGWSRGSWRKGSPPRRGGHCLQVRESPAHPISHTHGSQSHGWVSPCSRGPTVPSPPAPSPRLPRGRAARQRGAPVGSVPWETPVSTSGA